MRGSKRQFSVETEEGSIVLTYFHFVEFFKEVLQDVLSS